MPEQHRSVEPELADAPTVHLVPDALGHVTSVSLDLRPMSRPAIALPPEPRNEPVKDYAPGSPERAELQKRLRELERDRIEIPLVIGGQDVQTTESSQAAKTPPQKPPLARVPP